MAIPRPQTHKTRNFLKRIIICPSLFGQSLENILIDSFFEVKFIRIGAKVMNHPTEIFNDFEKYGATKKTNTPRPIA